MLDELDDAVRSLELDELDELLELLELEDELEELELIEASAPEKLPKFVAKSYIV